MSKLTNIEQKVLGKLQQMYGRPNKGQATSFLKNKFAFTSKQAIDLYTLWFLNYQEDGDYSNIEKVNRDIHPVLTILKRIQSGDLDEDDIPSLYYEEPISFCSGGGYYGENNIPCVSFDTHEVILKLDRDQWEETNISGLYEEDLYKYYEATSHSSGGYYEEYEDEEFNYASFDDQTLEYISQIALHSNRRDIVDYLSGGNVESEKVVEHLSDLLPKEQFESIRDEWLTDVGYETTRMRNNAVSEEYETEIKYDVSIGGNSYDIEIPMDEFIKIVEKEGPLNFAEFLDMEINPEVDLENVYHDTGYFNSDETDHIVNMRNSLEKLAEEYSDGSLLEYHDRLLKFRKLLESVGIEVTSSTWRDGDTYTSKDGRISFLEKELDILEGKIKFTYDGKEHMTSIDDFVNWAHNSVLPLQYESRKFIKKVLKQFILKS
tara:strand:+ start:10789 stop:12087 length:1299 start_codon:yes stop_codon:yes gene_type:complete